MEHYVIQRLDGYTDGKGSWIRLYGVRVHFPNKAMAVDAMQDYATRNPTIKYRVRKMPERK